MNLISKIKNNKTLVNGSLFSIFSFFNQGIAFLLLILLANFIAPAEYGQLSLFNTILQFMGYFIALSTQGFLSVSYFKRGKACFRQDFSTISLICIANTALLSIVMSVAGGVLSDKTGISVTFLWIIIVISFMTIYQHMLTDYYRILEDLKKFGIISCGCAALNFVLSLFLVIKCNLNWEGRVYAHLICSLLFGLLAIAIFYKNKLFTLNITKDGLKMIIFWGVPLIPHLASVWLKQGGDRFIINSYHTIEDVGLFSFALNLTSIIIMIGSSFNATNSVSIFKTLAKDISPNERKSLIDRQNRKIFVVYLVASALIVLGATGLVMFALPKYVRALPYFYILAIQGFGQCIYFLYCNYLFYYHRNKQLMYVTFITSVIHLGLSLLLTRYSLYLTCCIYVVTQICIDGLVIYLSKKTIAEKLLCEDTPLEIITSNNNN